MRSKAQQSPCGVRCKASHDLSRVRLVDLPWHLAAWS